MESGYIEMSYDFIIIFVIIMDVCIPCIIL
jgi:hypothetical protein